MAIYAVHEAAAVDAAQGALNARFIRQGYSPAAFAFGPFWLLANRLWRALALWLVAAALVAAALAWDLLQPAAALALYELSALLIGLEGAAWLSAALSRRGFAMIDIAAGANREAAEIRYFSGRGDAPPAVAPAPRLAQPSGPGSIIGLFPEASR